MVRIVKTTIAIPLEVSQEINAFVDRYDSTKYSTRQEFILSAIVEKLKTSYGSVTEDVRKPSVKLTEDVRKTYGSVTEETPDTTFNKFKGRFNDE